MKLRAAAVLTALAVTAGGALVAPTAETPPPTAANESTGAPAQAVGGTTPFGDIAAQPKVRTVTADPQVDAASPITDAALGAVVESVEDGTTLPADLSSKVTLDGELIRVEVAFADEEAARDAVRAAGGQDVAPITDDLFAASVPATGIAELEDSNAVESVVLPSFAVPEPAQIPVAATVGTKGGDVYDKTQIAQWHSLGLSGAGVSVGIIDYFRSSSWKNARAVGEVPATAGTYCRWGGESCSVVNTPASDDSGAHGVAVAEAIHDMAPGATLYLVSVATNEDLRKAIDYLASKKVKIISRSLGGYYDGPGDGTGTSAKLVSYAVSKGIAWFNSAGNAGAYLEPQSDGSKVWAGGYWRGKWRDTNKNGWMEFAHPVRNFDGSLVKDGSGNTMYQYYESLTIVCADYYRLRWSDWGVSDPTDYDIYRIASNGAVTGRYNVAQKKGVAPLEMRNGSRAHLACTTGSLIEVGIRKARNGSSSSGDVLELAGNSADIGYAAVSAGSAGNAFVDSKSKGMAAVGAVDPVAGTTIAGYSSRGPTNDGRINPKLSAGSNFTSQAYTFEGAGGRFNGTSAATPVVAGIAAVALERFDTKSPAQLVEYLRTSQTSDRGAAGADNTYGAGELIMKPLAIASFTDTPPPTITGSRTVGVTLIASARWTPVVRAASYQWFRGDTAIPGATRKSYTLTSADEGQRIRVEVTGSRPAFTPETVSSGLTGTITKPFVTAPAPTITGTLKVGRTLGASLGTWSPTPTTLTYQWYANGKAIAGATQRTHVVTAANVGTRLAVKVTAAAAGYTTTSRTSASTAIIVRPFTKAPTPRISGTAQVGKKLTAVTGTWSPKPSTLAYQWKADGKTIKGATKSTYVIASSLAGKRITVTVTAKKAGYTTGLKTSAKTATVKKR